MNAVAMFCLYFRQKGKKMVISRVGEYKYRRGCEFFLYLPLNSFHMVLYFHFFFHKKKRMWYKIFIQHYTANSNLSHLRWSSHVVVRKCRGRKGYIYFKLFLWVFLFLYISKEQYKLRRSLVLYINILLYFFFFKKVAIIKSNQGGGEKKF